AFRAGKSGVVITFESKEAATWLSTPEVWTTFAQSYEGGVKLRPRLYEVLLRNVPLSLDPTLPEFMAALSKENTLPDDWIDNARWMKPAARRSDSQRSAHVMLAFRTADAANEAIVTDRWAPL
ncbi:hypothetical protein AURDEDRAFT_44607, partial [Auricularia subglabra TFB-10046 SS5]